MNSVNEELKINTEISHVSRYIELLENSQKEFRRNQHFLYRGESRLEYELIPSVYRKDEYNSDIYHTANTEMNILTEFMTEAAVYIDLSTDDMFRWLEYAQHFGAPTRLLDWTSNPLVALYFACSDKGNSDGKVYILNSLIYRIASERINKLSGKIILEEAMKMIRDSEKTFKYPAIFKPYYMDKRMAAQSSEFMVWGYEKKSLDIVIRDLEKDGRIKELVDDEISKGMMVTHSKEISPLSEIHIKGEDKLRILHELDRMGISYARLFPGLDGVGKSVEWRFNRKNKI